MSNSLLDQIWSSGQQYFCPGCNTQCPSWDAVLACKATHPNLERLPVARLKAPSLCLCPIGSGVVAFGRPVKKSRRAQTQPA